jgi:hypothetical protein
MMSHQAVSGLKVPQCSGGLQITRERSSAAVPVLIVSLQDADKIGHAGSIPVFGRNRNLSIGRGLALLPNPQ